MRDTDGDGKADIIRLFGDYGQEGAYGTAMRIYQDYSLFQHCRQGYPTEIDPGELLPADDYEVILTDDYKNAEHGYEHIAKQSPLTMPDICMSLLEHRVMFVRNSIAPRSTWTGSMP